MRLHFWKFITTVTILLLLTTGHESVGTTDDTTSINTDSTISNDESTVITSEAATTKEDSTNANTNSENPSTVTNDDSTVTANTDQATTNNQDSTITDSNTEMSSTPKITTDDTSAATTNDISTTNTIITTTGNEASTVSNDQSSAITTNKIDDSTVATTNGESTTNNDGSSSAADSSTTISSGESSAITEISTTNTEESTTISNDESSTSPTTTGDETTSNDASSVTTVTTSSGEGTKETTNLATDEVSTATSTNQNTTSTTTKAPTTKLFFKFILKIKKIKDAVETLKIVLKKFFKQKFPLLVDVEVGEIRVKKMRVYRQESNEEVEPKLIFECKDKTDVNSVQIAIQLFIDEYKNTEKLIGDINTSENAAVNLGIEMDINELKKFEKFNLDLKESSCSITDCEVYEGCEKGLCVHLCELTTPYCQNNGYCIRKDPNRPSCICDSGNENEWSLFYRYSGDRCENSNYAIGKNTFILVVVFLSVFLLCAVGAIIFFMLRYRSKYTASQSGSDVAQFEPSVSHRSKGSFKFFSNMFHYGESESFRV